MFKKKFSVFLIILFLFSSINVFAGEENNLAKTITVKSEYEILTELKEADTTRLKEMGYNNSDIKKIKSMDIENQIKSELLKRSDLDYNSLQKMGYNSQEIEYLKSLTGNEKFNELEKLSSKVVCTNSLYNYEYYTKNNQTHAVFEFSWHWEKLPVMCLTDAIGLGWDSPYKIYPNSKSNENKHFITYYDHANDQFSTKTTKIIEKYLCTAEDKFKVGDTGPYGKGSAKYALNGYGRIHLYQIGYNQNVKFQFKYAHNSIGVTPSVSAPWGIGFSFEHAENIYSPSGGIATNHKPPIKK